MSGDEAPGADRVAELWRFPVKSFQGEPVESLTVGERRIAGDREWALLDAGTGKLLSAKTVPALLEAAAVTQPDGSVVLRLPSGDELVADGSPAVDEALSAWLDRPVRLRPATEAPPDLAYEMTFDPPNDDAQLVDIPSPPGTFLDLAALHLLTTRSLASCAGHRPDSVWDRRRFRPNVLVESGADDGDGYPEDAWVDHRLRVGSAVVQVLMRTVRCAMPLRAQPALADNEPLARDVAVFRTMRDVHDNHLGVYANVVEPGVVSVGDAVAVE